MNKMNIQTKGKVHDLVNKWTVIAGPCAAESETQVMATAKSVAEAGGHVLRAGLWKPRTSARSWPGVGEEGIAWMEKARKATGLAIATEVRDIGTLDKILAANFDVLWIGSRNAQNFELLTEVGKRTSSRKIPVILKRGIGSDLDEWLGAAEYVVDYNPNVILCERGIRGFPRHTRNVLDLQTAWLAKEKSKLPVIVDVSHAAGRSDLVLPMARAVKAAGLDGLMVEVHPDPVMARTDQDQQISLDEFKLLMEQLGRLSINS